METRSSKRRRVGPAARVDKYVAHLTAEPDDLPAALGRRDANATASTDTTQQQQQHLQQQQENFISTQPTAPESPRSLLAKAHRVAFRNFGYGADARDVIEFRLVEKNKTLHKPMKVRFSETTCADLRERESGGCDFSRIVFGAHRHINSCVVVYSTREYVELVAASKRKLVRYVSHDARAVHSKLGFAEDVDDLRRKMARSKRPRAWALRDGVLVAFGTSIASALATAVKVRRACEIQIRALASVGGDLDAIEPVKSKRECESARAFFERLRE